MNLLYRVFVQIKIMVIDLNTISIGNRISNHSEVISYSFFEIFNKFLKFIGNFIIFYIKFSKNLSEIFL